jgi:hypothetical protein
MQFFSSPEAEIRWDCTFDNRLEVVGIVGASPVFIRRPGRQQEDYYSGKHRRHCVNVQALVTADGQCAHLSKADCISTNDKAIFERSELAEFTSYQPPGAAGRRHRIIMGDLAYPEITRTCPGAIFPHKRPARGELTSDQKRDNRILSRDRIVVENFFGRWKTLFGICQEVY